MEWHHLLLAKQATCMMSPHLGVWHCHNSPEPIPLHMEHLKRVSLHSSCKRWPTLCERKSCVRTCATPASNVSKCFLRVLLASRASFCAHTGGRQFAHPKTDTTGHELPNGRRVANEQCTRCVRLTSITCSGASAFAFDSAWKVHRHSMMAMCFRHHRGPRLVSIRWTFGSQPLHSCRLLHKTVDSAHKRRKKNRRHGLLAYSLATETT